MKGKKYDSEIAKLHEQYPTKRAVEIAEMAGCKKSTVTRWRRSAGYGKSGVCEVLRVVPKTYKKTPEYIPRTYRPGTTHCLKCGESFESWDVRENRICEDCAPGHRRTPEPETFTVRL